MDPLRCPACDEPLAGNLGRVPASIDEEAVRVTADCTACAERLEVTATAAGVDVARLEGALSGA